MFNIKCKIQTSYSGHHEDTVFWGRTPCIPLSVTLWREEHRLSIVEVFQEVYWKEYLDQRGRR